MTCFDGVDVSQKMTAICVVDNAGRRLWRGQCPTVPAQISVLVRGHAGDGARIGAGIARIVDDGLREQVKGAMQTRRSSLIPFVAATKIEIVCRALLCVRYGQGRTCPMAP